jgi:hypothetical protein
MLLVRDGRNDARWSFGEIGPALGEKHKLITDAAQRGGELGDAPGAYLEKVIAAEIGVSPQRWANAKAGRERPEHLDYVHASTLRALAKYFNLDADHYLGPEAWLAYTPAITTDELEQRLLDVGYGHFLAMRTQGELRPADSLLAWLRTEHQMTRQGISVSVAREIDQGSEPTRATGIVDEVMEEEEQSAALFRAHDRLVIQLDAGKGWHVVLLQLTDALTPPHFTLRCLLPSYRHPGTELANGVHLPALTDRQGRPGFGLGADPGFVDLIAIVTRGSPLALPFTVSSDARFHVVDVGPELQRIKGALNALPATSLRVLHSPLRVV